MSDDNLSSKAMSDEVVDKNTDKTDELTYIMDNNRIGNDIINSVQTAFKEKYIDKINNVVKNQYDTVLANPTKEMRFMSVIKEFMPNENHEHIDRIINAYSMINTLKNLKSTLNSNNLPMAKMDSGVCAHSINAESIHDDGIYEIDQKCMLQIDSKKADLLSMLMMMVFIDPKFK